MGGKSKAPTIGYWHKMTLYTGLCHGPVDAYLAREWGGEMAWEGSQTASGNIAINKPALFGGEKKEGGIVGTLSVRMGEPGQMPHALLTALRPGPWPAARGLLTTVYDGDVSAMTPYVKPFRERVARWTAGWGTAVWQSGLCQIDAGCNPAHIIYQVLTNPRWGCGLPTAMIDEASFLAAAQTLKDEGFGLCLTWRQGGAGEFIDSVCQHIGGMWADVNGVIQLRLFRGGYSMETLPLLDESAIIDVQEWDQPLLANGTVNEVTVVGVDDVTGKDISVTAQNLAAIQAQGRVVAKKLELPGLHTTELCARVADREVRAESMLPFRVKVKVKGKFGPFIRGEVRALAWSRKGIVRAPVRVMEIDEGITTDNSYILTLVQDVNGMVDSTYVQPGGTDWTPPDTTPVALSPEAVYEASYRDLVRGMSPGDLAAVGDLAGYLVAVGARPAATAYGYDLRTRTGAAAFATRASGDFTPTAQLGGAIVAEDGPTATTLVNARDLATVAVGDEAIVGTEHCRVTAIDANAGTITLARGCVDTVPAAHAAATQVWFPDRLFGGDPTQYLDSEVVDAKLCTRTASGVLADGSATTRSLTMASRQARPYPPGLLRIETEAWPASLSLTAHPTLTATWAHRDRLLQADQLIDTAQTSIGPETGVTYTAKWYLGGTLARTQTAITGTSDTYTPASTGTVRVEIEAVRDGLESWQVLAHEFEAMVSGSWVTAIALSSSGNSNGWGGYTLRSVIPASDLIAGSKLRLILRGASSGTDLAVSKAYIGLQAASGDAYDFATAPVQVLVGGSGSFSVPTGATVTSDEILLSIDGTKNLVLAVACTAGDMATHSRTDWMKYEKAGSDAATVDTSGYSPPTSHYSYLVSKVEVYVP